jgi:hypothetical protein
MRIEEKIDMHLDEVIVNVLKNFHWTKTNLIMEIDKFKKSIQSYIKSENKKSSYKLDQAILNAEAAVYDIETELTKFMKQKR